MDRTVKVGIISGIISTVVFVYFLNPILRVFGKFVLYFSSLLYQGLIDSIYARSALGVPTDPALLIFSMLSGALLGMSVSFITIFLRQRTDKKRKHDPIVIRKIILVGFGGLIIISLIFFYQTWSLYTQYQVVTSFNQHIKILAPYIDQHQRDLLISEYSLVKTKAEYDSLYKKLYSISKANNINLPDNLSYGYWSI